jgi:hypothetical protein
MEKKMLAEILSAHADQLSSGRPRRRDYLSMFPTYQGELGSLLKVAERVKAALVPVDPEPAFQAGLERDLLAVAQRRPELLATYGRERRMRAIIGVAILGSAISLASIIAYLLRVRLCLRHRCRRTRTEQIM